MKISKLLLFVSLFISLYGCSEEQPYKPEKEYIAIWEGDSSHAKIKLDLSRCNYTLISIDPEVATAIIDKMGVYVTTHKRGSTIIQLIDADNDKIVCEIYVSVTDLGSPNIIEWGIPLVEGNPGYPGIIVEAKDTETKKIIEEELKDKGSLFIGARYSFNPNSLIFTAKTRSGIMYEGTYEWNITSLTLRYDGKVEKYSFKFATGMSYGFFIQADKTEEYQLQYPNAGITEVKVKRVWQDRWILP